MGKLCTVAELFLAAPAGLGGIPAKVMNALKARFPNPEVQKCTPGRGGRDREREIPVKDLPAAVRKAMASRYPKATIKEVMAITAVKDGKDTAAGYEISLEAAGKRAVEVTSGARRKNP